MFKKGLQLLRIRRDERWLAVAAACVLTALNALVILHYYDRFTPLVRYYWALFVRNFHVSGFDPISYSVLSYWSTGYNVYRHPLLAFFMYLPNQLNQGLMMLFGANGAIFVMAFILIVCGVYSFLFLYRILHEVVGTSRRDALLLTWFGFGMAYVMLSMMVPDHFSLSMCMLLFTLYVSGIQMKKHHPLRVRHYVLLFILTAGISLNNGIKVFLAALFVNGKRFFRPKFLLLAVILPSILIWGFARWEYAHFVWPKEVARKEAKEKKDKELRAKLWQEYADTAQVKDSAQIAAGVKKIIAQRAHAKYKADHQKPIHTHSGKPIAKGEFIGWTDVTTSRWDTAVENLFGEAIQLHQDHLLGDTLRKRPVIVRYNWTINYVVEALIVALFLFGIWKGRREKFLWLCLSFFAYDMLLHMGLGFGINEVYIMSAHWLFVIPIAIGYSLTPNPSPRGRGDKESGSQEAKETGSQKFLPLGRIGGGLLVLWLWIYNVWLIVSYLCP